LLVKTTRSTKSSEVVLFPQQPALRLICDTAPIGLACLSLDCRYLQVNQRLTEICGISVEDHLGRSVRECVPALADSVEAIVRSIMETGEPVIGVEVAGQRADQVEEHIHHQSFPESVSEERTSTPTITAAITTP